jgi:chromosome condensin MukBEF ATPase and DNA-binding subunit MukB
MKGKHGQRAERRHLIDRYEAELNEYKRRYSAAVQSLDEVKRTAAETEAALRQELAAVRAQVDAAVSPKLLAAQERIGALEGWKEGSEEGRRAAQKRWEAVFERAVDLLVEHSKMTRLEIFEALMPGNTAITLGIPQMASKKLGREAVEIITRARGQRRPASPP